MQGKSYFIHVRAMNVCGWSDYSPWNDIRVITLYVCMYVCMCVSAVVTSMEVQLRYIEPFDIGEWQRMYRPELLDYSGILQIHPAAKG
jgi:hypothetical protein